jgi:hypothetical protein
MYLCNFITAFWVLDISNSERKNLKIDNRMHFYDTISVISKSLVSGFAAPLMYILILGNYAAIAYSIIFNLAEEEDYRLLKVLRNILTIIPSIFIQLILYIIYICRNRSFKVDFGGDYIRNTIKFPILNTDILAAYIESVNFYMYRNYRGMYYLKSYGKYSNKIDKVCIKDYLSICYSICLVLFIIFFLFIMK